MDAHDDPREREKRELLRRLSELLVEEEREAGTFDGVPHFSRLEDSADQLADALGRASREALGREVLQQAEASLACPECGRRVAAQVRKRSLLSKAGPVETPEIFGHCPTCRRDFFPST